MRKLAQGLLQSSVTMFQRILVVFEEEQVSDIALTSARELARRMDAEVTLLMLIRMAFKERFLLSSKRRDIRRLEQRVSQRMTELAEPFLSRGVAVGAAVRLGDPAQELMKFLAERRPFQAVIWGSHLDIGGKALVPKHWLRRIVKALECPVLIASKKGDWENL